MFINFYPRDAIYARAGNSNRNVSVRHAPVLCQNEESMISSRSGSPKILVFLRQILPPNSKVFTPSGSLKLGWDGKIQRFDILSLSVNISKTVADTAKVTIND